MEPQLSNPSSQILILPVPKIITYPLKAAIKNATNPFMQMTSLLQNHSFDYSNKANSIQNYGLK